MRYINTYKIFESKSEQIENIKDICLELTDIGMNLDLGPGDHYNGYFIIIKAPFEYINVEAGTGRKSKIYNWSHLKDCVLRLKDYLGDDYKKFWYIGEHTKGAWVEIELDENTEIDGIITSIGILYT